MKLYQQDKDADIKELKATPFNTKPLCITYPAIAAQWHPTKNGDLTPEDVTAGSAKKVWWQCEKGHVWQAQIKNRTFENSGCPVCSNHVVLNGFNDFATVRPEIATQWHPTRNGALTPDMFAPNSRKKIWWQCEKGHAWQTLIASRSYYKSGCPICANRIVLKGYNDLATTHPKLAAEWHPTLNGDLTPDMVVAGSGKKFWWQCAFGHVWKTPVAQRAVGRQHGCPVCAGRYKQKNVLKLK